MSRETGTTDSTGATDTTGVNGSASAPSRGKVTKATKYAVPVAVLTVAVASIGLVPALADNGDPDLPGISAEELVAKIADSDVERFSGTVKTSTDLGLPGDSLKDLLPSGAPSSESGDVDPASKLRSLFNGEHTVKVAVDGEDKQRATIAGDAGDYTFVHNAGTVWGYDSAAKKAFKGTAPKDGELGKGGTDDTPKGLEKANPQTAAKELLAALGDTTSVTVDGTTRVADRDAYQLSLKPKDAPDSTIDDLRIAVDAENGVPLKVTLNAKSGGAPIGELGFTDVDFGKQDASTFDFTPPKGTEIIEEGDLEKELGKNHDKGQEGMPDLGQIPGLEGIPGLDGLDGAKGGDEAGSGDAEVIGKGWNSVLAVKADAKNGGDDGEKGDQAMPDSGKMGKLLDSYTDKVEGDFGTGRVVSTKVVNALLTDDGSVYVGAVTKEGLVKAANAG